MSAPRRRSSVRAHLGPLLTAVAVLAGLLSATGPAVGTAGAQTSVRTALAGPSAYERPVPEVPVQECSKYAAPTGDDANPGTRTAPVRTLTALSVALSPGQTGCVQDGSTTVFDDPTLGSTSARLRGGAPGQPKIIRPETLGARATFRSTGRFYVDENQSDLVLKDLTLVKTVGGSSNAMMVDGDRVTLDGIDLSYADNICLDVGGDPRGGGTAASADDFVLINSRVHDCGLNHVNDPTDPGGAHGLYISYVRDGADADSWGAIVHNSVFDHNKDRGIQLYPDVDDTLIDQVVIFANGSNLNIGSQTSGPDDPLAVRSDRSVVRNSIIGNSRLDAYEPGNANITATADVLGNFAHGVGNGAANVVRDSCLYNTSRNDHLFEVTDNDTTALRMEGMTLNQPAQFFDLEARDFRLSPASPCQGMGLADASRLPGAIPAPPQGMTLTDPVTDNYKTWKDGESRPGVGTENRTSFLFTGVEVGGETYVVPQDQLAVIASGNGAPQVRAEGIPLATSPGAAVSAHLTHTPPPGSPTTQPTYRVFSQGTFGIFTSVDRAIFADTPLTTHLQVKDLRGATLGSVPVSYRHDAQVAALSPDYLEHGAAAGRWFVDAGPTPLNWPDSIAVSRTSGGPHSSTVHVPAATPSTLHATPVDIAGIAVPRFRTWDGQTVPQVEVFKGTASQGLTTGTTTSRTFSVNQPLGSFAYSVKALCDGFCKVDYVKSPLERTFTLESGTTSPPSAPRGVFAEGGDGQATVFWSEPADLGGAPVLDYTVTAHRVGDAQAGARTCTTADFSCTVTGLFNLADTAEPYRFTVVARNAVGTGPSSTPSNGVRPALPFTPLHRPDASITTASGAVGREVVNATGEGQILDITLPAGSTRTVDLQVHNAGNVTDTFGLAEARGGQHSAISRQWTRDGIDVTHDLSPAVGWHVLPDVAAGDHRTLGLTLAATADVATGTSATYALHAYHSPVSAGIKDVAIVRVTITAAPVTPPPPPPLPPPPPPPPPPAVTFSRLSYGGPLVVGTRLRARVSVSAPTTGVRLVYRWLRGRSVIKGATGRAYRLTRADRGKRITLRVTARATGHTTATRSYRRKARVRVSS